MLKTYFKKAGGKALLLSYFRNKIFIYAVSIFLFLPKTKKGLELFRECINIKLFEKIKKKYNKIICDKNYPHNDSKTPKKVWFCWLQGLDVAPDLVKACFNSVRENLPDYEIIVITSENYRKYTSIPQYIIKKWENGIISNTQFSDVLRVNLLVNNGGLWIDSTILMTSPLPKSISNSSLFFFMTQKPGSDGNAFPVSNWFLCSAPKNPVLMTIQDLLFSYWEKNSHLYDYFIFHMFQQISLDKYPDLASMMPKYTNETPHLMLFELGEKFDKEKYDDICQQSFLHKLTNKLPLDVLKKEGTFYRYIISNYGEEKL